MQLKTKNGITLIALVVTIIVLLILAGVSINMALGNNGIFEKAKDAQNKMNEAIKSDMDEINALTNLLDNYIGENVTGGEGTTPKFEFTGTTNPSDSYVGYYADINGDGEITEEDDGIIFADLLRGGSGQWYNSDGAYSIGTISSAKSYKVSSSNYTEGKFGDAFNITYSDYNSTYGLSIYYWSSSLVNIRDAWTSSFEEGCMNPYGTLTSRLSVRLCTTF